MRQCSIALVLILVMGAASAAGAAGSGWSIQRTPNPTGATNSDLSGVACPSKSACTAVGASANSTASATLAEHWSGTKWSIQSTPSPMGSSSSGLDGIACMSESTCVAVGDYFNGTDTVTLAERWNGTKWSIQATPNPPGAQISYLDGVACTSASACVAVGYYATVTAHGGTDLALAERWNGTKWSIQKTPKPAGATLSELKGLDCTSASDCTAVGYYYKDTPDCCATLAERWNGIKWSIQKTPSPGFAPELDDVACASKSACTAVGYTEKDVSSPSPPDVKVAERWNGTKWSIQKTPKPAGARGSVLSGVACTSASACTAVGHSYKNNRSPDVILAERWNGTKWSLQTAPNPTGAYRNSGLIGVACASKSACTAVGSSSNGTREVTLAERWSGG